MYRKLSFTIASMGIFALLSGAAVAAVDDAGMKYISASEGLSGSVRIRMFEDGNERSSARKETDPHVGFGESRLVYKGDAEVGEGMAVTYLFEFRPGDIASEDDEERRFGVEYMDVGLKGGFGHFRVGAIESVSSAIVPSPDRTNDVGDDGAKMAGDYNERGGGWRWVSPDIRGLLLGISASMVDLKETSKDEGDKTFDQYDVAIAYSLPTGLDIGASYSVIPTPFEAEGTAAQKGFRLGAVYERDNWGVGYNFHNYTANAPKPFEQGTGDTTLDAALPGKKFDGHARWHKDTEYLEHVVGANVLLGRFNFAFNHSRASLNNPTLDTDTQRGVQGIDLDFETSAVDIAYRMGSRAQLIAAYTVSKIKGDNLSLGNLTIGDLGSGIKKYYLMSRIDF